MTTIHWLQVVRLPLQFTVTLLLWCFDDVFFVWFNFVLVVAMFDISLSLSLSLSVCLCLCPLCFFSLSALVANKAYIYTLVENCSDGAFVSVMIGQIYLCDYCLMACRSKLLWQTKTQILATDISKQNEILYRLQVGLHFRCNLKLDWNTHSSHHGTCYHCIAFSLTTYWMLMTNFALHSKIELFP